MPTLERHHTSHAARHGQGAQGQTRNRQVPPQATTLATCDEETLNSNHTLTHTHRPGPHTHSAPPNRSATRAGIFQLPWTMRAPTHTRTHTSSIQPQRCQNTRATAAHVDSAALHGRTHAWEDKCMGGHVHPRRNATHRLGLAPASVGGPWASAAPASRTASPPRVSCEPHNLPSPPQHKCPKPSWRPCSTAHAHRNSPGCEAACASR